MINKSFDELMNGYQNNQLTEEELTRFLQLIQQQEQEDSAKKSIDALFNNPSVSGLSNPKRADVIFKKIIAAAEEQEALPEEKVVRLGQTKWPAFLRIAIAASVLLTIGLGWIYFATNKPDTTLARNTEKKRDSATLVIHHETNNTGKDKRIQLADGSLIVLANNSEITYQEPFINKRDIFLTGKAFFKVAKDKTNPFTVFSGDISTTALGTAFTVTTVENKGQIIVRLYEGKVVVKAVDRTSKKLKKDVYLLPGQAFVYGGKPATAEANTLAVNTTAAPEQIMSEELAKDNPAVPENPQGSYFMFNNQPLAKVLDDLAALYNTKIVYDKKDVQNLYFIGKYNSSDSLETIVKRIAILNNLTLTKKDDAFILSR